MAATFTYSDSDYTFRAANHGVFVLRSRATGYEHEFAWSDNNDEKWLCSVTTMETIGKAYTFSQAVAAAKRFMSEKREIECNMSGFAIADAQKTVQGDENCAVRTITREASELQNPADFGKANLVLKGVQFRLVRVLLNKRDNEIDQIVYRSLPQGNVTLHLYND